MVATVDEHHTVGDLCAALAGHLAQPVEVLLSERLGRPVLSTATVARSGLVSGDTVSVADSDSIDAQPVDTSRRCAGGVVLDVLSGPDAGASHRLADGCTVVGRGAHL